MNPSLYIFLCAAVGVVIRIVQYAHIRLAADEEKANLKRSQQEGWRFFSNIAFWVILTALVASAGFYIDLRGNNGIILLKLFAITFGSYWIITLFMWLMFRFVFKSLNEEERRVSKICAAIPSSTTGKVNLDLYPASQENFAVLVAINHICSNLFTLCMFMNKKNKQGKLKTALNLAFNPATLGIILAISINTYILESRIEHEVKNVIETVIVGSFTLFTMTILGKVIVDSFSIEVFWIIIQHLPLLMLLAAIKVILQPNLTFKLALIAGLQGHQNEFMLLGFGTVSTSALLFLEHKEEAKNKVLELYAAAFLMQLALYLFLSEWIINA